LFIEIEERSWLKEPRIRGLNWKINQKTRIVKFSQINWTRPQTPEIAQCLFSLTVFEGHRNNFEYSKRALSVLSEFYKDLVTKGGFVLECVGNSPESLICDMRKVTQSRINQENSSKASAQYCRSFAS
jgi:hypothetical protein